MEEENERAIDMFDLPRLGSDPERTYRLGIMGGTFDPIHNGHLVAAEQAFDDLGLDLVVFMPAGRPAFKLDKKVTSGEDRYAMTLLATSDKTRISPPRASRSTARASPIRRIRCACSTASIPTTCASTSSRAPTPSPTS